MSHGRCGPPDATAASATAAATRVASETIYTTANHPWLTSDRGWVHAGDLRPGEQVVTLDGSSASGATVAWVRVVAGAGEMDNLTVAQEHSYAVGASRAVVVHNTELWDPTARPCAKKRSSSA